MHPDLDDFLESAFDNVAPVVERVGHVLVEPDYNAEPDQNEASGLAQELVECLRAQTLPEDFPEAGVPVIVDAKYALLKKYVLRISLHRGRVPGAWVEVAPPGNWI